MKNNAKKGTWKEKWAAFLLDKYEADEVVDAAIMDFRRNIQTMLKMEALTHPGRMTGNGERLYKLCDQAQGDLITLAREGANPAILLRLAARSTTFDFDEPSGYERREEEFNQVVKPEYWKKTISKLERARTRLLEFMDTEIYRDIEKTHMMDDTEISIYAFSRMCKEVRITEGVIDRLIRSIRELRLHQGGRKIEHNPPYVWVELTKGERGPKPESGKYKDWDWPLYGLWKYLTVRTGKPHLRLIARLLHFAGFGLPGAISSNEKEYIETTRIAQKEIDRVRKGVERLGTNAGIGFEVGEMITNLEVDYETRELLNYGGFTTHPWNTEGGKE